MPHCAWSYPPTVVARDAQLKIRLTHGEKAALLALARARGRSVSEVVRSSLPIFEPMDAEIDVTVQKTDA
jgi:hypothetical protein